MLVTVVSVTACVAACSFLVPQLVRLVRTKDAAGVSATMAGIGALSCIAWMFYGLAVDVWPLALTGGLGACEYLGFCALLRRSRRPLGRATAVTAVGAVLLIGSMALAEAAGRGMWSGLAAALDAAVVAQYLPAVLAAHRSPSTSGIAAGTWAMVGLNGALWGMYGFLIGDVALIGYGLALGAATVGVATAFVQDRWARQPEHVPLIP